MTKIILLYVILVSLFLIGCFLFYPKKPDPIEPPKQNAPIEHEDHDYVDGDELGLCER